MRISSLLTAISPFRTVLFFVVVACLGVLVIPQIPVSLTPPTKPEVLSIQFRLPNTAPLAVEQQATSVLENTFSQLTGLQQISSVSNYDGGSITLRFQSGTDMEFKRYEVLALIRQIYPNLPKEMPYPTVAQSVPNEREEPLLVYSIAAPFAPSEIGEVANAQLANPLRQIPALERAQIEGALRLQLSVRYRSEQLAQYNITPTQIVQALQAQTQTRQMGMVAFSDTQQFTAVLAPDAVSLKALQNMRIAMDSGTPIWLSDLAEVSIREETPQQFYRINGNNAIRLTLYTHKNVNKLVVAQEIQNHVKQLQQSLPKGYSVQLEYNDTEFMQAELEKIYRRSALSITILIGFIVLIHRNISYLFILLSGIAINLGITGVALYALQLQIHLYTLAGLTVSLGFIIDNAIVMLSHYHRTRTKTVFLALLAASFTTIAALLLVLFLPEEERLNLTDFAVVVALNLGVSLAVALWYTPALYQLIFQRKTHATLSKNPKRIPFIIQKIYWAILNQCARFRRWYVALHLLAFGLPVFMLPSHVSDERWAWYNQTVGSDFYQEEIRPYVDKALGGALRLFVREVYENAGFRNNEKTLLYVNAEMGYGHTPEQMNHMIGLVERYLAEVTGIERFVTRVYSGQYARITISFTEETEQSFLPYQLKNRLIANSIDWGGVEWVVYGVGKGFSNSHAESLPAFRVEMRGYNYQTLDQQASVLAEKLLAHKRIQKVNTNERRSFRERTSENYVFTLDAAQANARGITSPQIAQQLAQQAPQQSPIGQFFLAQMGEKKQVFPIVVEAANSDDFSKFDLLNTPLENRNLQGITRYKPKEVGALFMQKNASAIYKENRQYIRIVGFQYYGSPHFGKKYLTEQLEAMEFLLPMGYSAKPIDRQWGSEQAQRQYELVFLLIIIVYGICCILFESFRFPWMIISAIPLSFIGVFITFAWFDFYFDQGGYASFILLGGLVVNATIFIIHDYLHQPKLIPHNQKVWQAVQNKAVPILLTIVSTICGLIPFLLEGDSEIFWFALAAGTIGGLVVSLYAVFVFVPVLLWHPVQKKSAKENR